MPGITKRIKRYFNDQFGGEVCYSNDVAKLEAELDEYREAIKYYEKMCKDLCCSGVLVDKYQPPESQEEE